ncbi:hypothetical protein [Acinetobacter sp. P8-3-8]|uniref:hypothetical protein n=1 Tax=Acinetobacter sp. P8-3-8 TaxID=1029823 RepID=UPI00024869D6|nr:hypothetical protein [Acinetobacter sp. P8-3-8]
MNMLSNYAPEAPTFQTLVVADEFVIQGSKVYFSLIVPNYSACYVSAVVEANQTSSSLAWNTTSDPQNDVDVNYDLLEVATWHRPIVEDFDEILAVQGLRFALTDSQVYTLNEMLKAHFEEEKVNELKGVA